MLRSNVWIAGVLLLCTLCTLGTLSASPSKRPGHFDRFEFLNLSPVPVNDVKVELLDQNGIPFGSCPPGGYSLGTVLPGQSVMMVIDETVEGKWVTKVRCNLIYSGGPAGNVIEVLPVTELVQASFSFSQPMPPAGVVYGVGLTGDGQQVIGIPQ